LECVLIINIAIAFGEPPDTFAAGFFPEDFNGLLQVADGKILEKTCFTGSSVTWRWTTLFSSLAVRTLSS